MSNIRKSCIFTVALSLSLCLSLFGCSQNDKVGIEPTRTYLYTSNRSVISTDAETTENEKQSEESSSLISNTDKKETNTSKAITTKKNVISTTLEASTAKNAVTNTSTTKVTATEPEKLVKCTVTIDCTKALANKDKIKENHEQYLNGNGMILDSTNVTVKQGETVYDALKKVCAEKSIPLNVKETKYGCYIVGINNIDEKDCGQSSGWMYMVNGSYPNVSTNKYVVSNGDNIVFIYTC